MTGDVPPGSTHLARELLTRLKQVLKTTDTIVWEVNLEEMTVDYFGPVTSVVGVPRGELDDALAVSTHTIHPDDRVVVDKQFEDLLGGLEETVDVEHRTNPDNGPVRWIRTQAFVEDGTADQPTILVGLSTDITPLKEQKARLEAFASVVSHDLRNPLSVAKGRLNLARESIDSEDLDAVADAHDRMETLIEDLLTLARDDEDIGDIETVALDELVTNAWNNVSTRDAELDVDTDWRFRADGSRLTQLLENLLRNAVEHGGGGVTVRVGLIDGGFYVEDDGVGISDDERDLLGISSELSAGSASGLGLRIVTQIVEAHGWEIEVLEGRHGGARFEISGVESA